MSKVREFFVQLPYLCGASNAERWSKVNALQFDAEVAGGTIFDKSDADKENPVNRLDTAFGFLAFVPCSAKTAYCQDLAELVMLAHYKESHGETQYDKRIDELWASLAAREIDYPDVAAVMSVEAAKADGGW